MDAVQDKQDQLEKIRIRVQKLKPVRKNIEKLWSMWLDAPDNNTREIIENEALFNRDWLTKDQKIILKEIKEVVAAERTENAFFDFLNSNNGALLEQSNESALFRLVEKDPDGICLAAALAFFFLFPLKENPIDEGAVMKVLSALIRRDQTGEHLAKVVGATNKSIGKNIKKEFAYSLSETGKAIRKKIYGNLIKEKKTIGAFTLLKMNTPLLPVEKEKKLLNTVIEGDNTGLLCMELINLMAIAKNIPVWIKRTPFLFDILRKKDKDFSLTVSLLETGAIRIRKMYFQKPDWKNTLTREYFKTAAALVKKDKTGMQSLRLLLLNRWNPHYARNICRDTLDPEQRKELFASAWAKNSPYPLSAEALSILWSVAQMEAWHADLSQEGKYWRESRDQIADQILTQPLGPLEHKRDEVIGHFLCDTMRFSSPYNAEQTALYRKKTLGIFIPPWRWNPATEILAALTASTGSGSTASSILCGLAEGANQEVPSSTIDALWRKVIADRGQGAAPEGQIRALLMAAPKLDISRELVSPLAQRLLQSGKGECVSKIFTCGSPYADIFTSSLKGVFDKNPLLTQDVKNGQITPYAAALLFIYGDLDPSSPLREPLLTRARSERRKTLERLYSHGVVPPARDFVKFLMDVHGNHKIANPEAMFWMPDCRHNKGQKDIFALLAEELKNNPDEETYKLFTEFLSKAGSSLCEVTKSAGVQAKKEYFGVAGTVASQISEPDFNVSDRENQDDSIAGLDVF